MSSPILIDGSMLEGGGQLIRNAVAFSALLAHPIVITNVRHNRKPPGLKPQHVAGLKLAAEISGAHASGVEKGSTEITFHPQRLRTGFYLGDPGTAGSTTLLLQASLPCLLYSPAFSEPSESTLVLRGGTNATSAPQIDYTTNVFLPFLRRYFYLEPSLEIRRRGYYPRGGGEISLRLRHISGPLPAVTLTIRGNVTAVRGKAYVAGALPLRIANKMMESAKSHLLASSIDPTLIRIQVVRESDENAVGNGSGIVLWAETDGGCTIGGSAVGAKGVDAAKSGGSAAAELVRNMRHGGCVDEYLQDQIIIFMALAKGKSVVAAGPLTMHTKTAIWLAEKLTDAKFKIEDEPGTARILITCEGIGLTSPFAEHSHD